MRIIGAQIFASTVVLGLDRLRSSTFNMEALERTAAMHDQQAAMTADGRSGSARGTAKKLTAAHIEQALTNRKPTAPLVGNHFTVTAGRHA